MSLIKKIGRRLKHVRDTVFKVLINIWYLFRFKVMRKEFGVYCGPKREIQIIVSLTSFPARMDKIHLCLQSLLLQDMKPDKILVYLGEEEFDGIELPEKVKNLEKNGVEFKFVEDLKPHTKYFYSMQEYREACIITVDDDVYYRPKLVKDLYNAYKKKPDNISCTRAHKIRFNSGKMLPYNSWDYETKEYGKASHLYMATGVGGVLYPPHIMPDETFNKDVFVELCLKADDVWLMAMEILNGTKVYPIKSTKTKYVVGIWGSEKVALFQSNVGKSQNDIYIQNVFTRYGIYERLSS